jgi:hypothetical protein
VIGGWGERRCTVGGLSHWNVIIQSIRDKLWLKKLRMRDELCSEAQRIRGRYSRGTIVTVDLSFLKAQEIEDRGVEEIEQSEGYC